MFFLPSRHSCISYAPGNPFLLAPLPSLPFLFSFFNRVWHSVGSLEKKERKRKGKGGEKKETKNSYHKREHLPDESLSCYYSFRPSMVNRGIGRTLKINLSGIDSTIQRGFVRNLDSVERAELHLGFNRAWKWRFLISKKFSMNDPFLFLLLLLLFS